MIKREFLKYVGRLKVLYNFLDKTKFHLEYEIDEENGVYFKKFCISDGNKVFNLKPTDWLIKTNNKKIEVKSENNFIISFPDESLKYYSYNTYEKLIDDWRYTEGEFEKWRIRFYNSIKAEFEFLNSEFYPLPAIIHKNITDFMKTLVNYRDDVVNGNIDKIQEYLSRFKLHQCVF